MASEHPIFWAESPLLLFGKPVHIYAQVHHIMIPPRAVDC